MEITEDWVRGLTGWKPFKEGKAMADQGLVAGFKQSGEVFQGTLREGRLNLRPVVKVVGPTDVRVQCGCPDHRATGGVCAHAVAILLSALKGPREPLPSQDRQLPVQQASTASSRAWDIRFSPRLEAEWAAGNIVVRLLPSKDTPGDSDQRLNGWLASRNLLPGTAQPLALRLAGSDAGKFLDLAAGHPHALSAALSSGCAATLRPEGGPRRLPRPLGRGAQGG